MLTIERNIPEISGCTPEAIPESVLTSSEPLVLKGLVAHWPATVSGKRSALEVDAYVRRFYNQAPVTVYHAEPETRGRIFYNEDLTGFNYTSLQANLNEVLNNLLQYSETNTAPTYYVGSTLIDNWLPGFRAENDLALTGQDPLASIWIGNRSRIPAHYDFPDNIACVVAGHRRFTLFPPDQLANLYVGPLDFTPSGQPVSLVDFHNPDYTRYPRFREALAVAQVAELEPGDALFIPSMWWHHVESLSAYNILVNYWWRRTPGYLGNPTYALQHALLSLRELPPEQRRAWQGIFEHYVFTADEATHAHIPEHSRGMLGDLDERAARRLRAQLLSRLNR